MRLNLFTGGPPVEEGASSGSGFRSDISPFVPGGRFFGIPAPHCTTSGAKFTLTGAGRAEGELTCPRDPVGIVGEKTSRGSITGGGEINVKPGSIRALLAGSSGGGSVPDFKPVSGVVDGTDGLPGAAGIRAPVTNVISVAGIKPNLPTFSGGAGGATIPTAGSS